MLKRCLLTPGLFDLHQSLNRCCYYYYCLYQSLIGIIFDFVHISWTAYILRLHWSNQYWKGKPEGSLTTSLLILTLLILSKYSPLIFHWRAKLIHGSRNAEINPHNYCYHILSTPLMLYFLCIIEQHWYKMMNQNRSMLPFKSF